MAARVMNPTHLSDLAGRGLVTRAGSATAAQERTLPLLPVLAALVPQGALQRGNVVGCDGDAAVSLVLAVAAGPSQQGAWVAVAGLPTLGLAASAEAGVVLERLVAVTEPVDGACRRVAPWPSRWGPRCSVPTCGSNARQPPGWAWATGTGWRRPAARSSP